MSLFNRVKELPPDPVFGMGALYREDSRLDKVNLTLGVYHNENLEPEIMQVVKKAENHLLEEEKTKTYLSQLGHHRFLEESKKLLFGREFTELHGERIAVCQNVGGTGALRIGGEFLCREISKQIFLPEPTWANHHGVFPSSGMEVAHYPYYDRKKSTISFDAVVDALDQLEEKSVVLLHGCCHNPTGCDFSKEQWMIVEEKVATKKLIPFFDIAYLGFAKSVEEDAWAIRYFAAKGHPLFAALSFSKSFGLYAERVGALFVLTQNRQERVRVESVLKRLVRVQYSNPPLHGAALVGFILGHPLLRQKWEEELETMKTRVDQMRQLLFDHLSSCSNQMAIDSLKDQVGMFVLLPIKEPQVVHLMRDYGIYMMKSGRINLTGLNRENIARVVKAIVSVCVVE